MARLAKSLAPVVGPVEGFFGNQLEKHEERKIEDQQRQQHDEQREQEKQMLLDELSTAGQEIEKLKAPKVEKPAKMPLPDDDAVRRAKRRSAAKQRARRGRASTIFTEGDGLGG